MRALEVYWPRIARTRAAYARRHMLAFAQACSASRAHNSAPVVCMRVRRRKNMQFPNTCVHGRVGCRFHAGCTDGSTLLNFVNFNRALRYASPLSWNASLATQAQVHNIRHQTSMTTCLGTLSGSCKGRLQAIQHSLLAEAAVCVCLYMTSDTKQASPAPAQPNIGSCAHI